MTSETVCRYSGVEGRVLSPAGSDSLACIVRNVPACDAGTVVLKGWHHVIWSMDVKRIVPRVRIVAQLDSLPCIAPAAHLRRYIDDVESRFRGMLGKHRMQASMLDAVVGR